jgi:hypothetical protein
MAGNYYVIVTKFAAIRIKYYDGMYLCRDHPTVKINLKISSQRNQSYFYRNFRKCGPPSLLPTYYRRTFVLD